MLPQKQHLLSFSLKNEQQKKERKKKHKIKTNKRKL